MRAAVYESGTPELILGDVDIEDPGPGQVRVRVHHCGICHSDYTVLHSALRRAARRCSATRRRASSTRSARASRCWRPATRSCSRRSRRAALLLVPARPAGVLREQRRACSAARSSTARPVCPAAVSRSLPRPRRRRLRRVRDDQRDRRGEGARPTRRSTIACVIGCAVQTGVGRGAEHRQGRAGRDRARARARRHRPLGRAGRARRRRGAASSPATRSTGGARPAQRASGATDRARPRRRRRRRRHRATSPASAPTTRSSAAGVAALAAVGIDGDACRRLDRARRRAAARRDARARPARAVRHRGEEAHGLLPRAAATRCATSRAWSRCGGRASSTSRPWSPPRRPLDEINEAFTDLAAGVGIRTVID